MTSQIPNRSVSEIQRAADGLAVCRDSERPDALETLAKCIFDHFSRHCDENATAELFSKQLPNNIQRFAAVWLLRILTRSSMALQFADTERLVAGLFDQVFQHDVYQRINIDTGTQTFEKIQALTDYLQTKIADAETLVSATPSLSQILGLRQDMMRLFNDKATQPFLIALLSRQLISASAITSLFETVKEYADNEDNDPIYMRDMVSEACDSFESEAIQYGTNDADVILGGIARRLKSAVTNHFESLEASLKPNLDLSPIAKKYPLTRLGAKVVVKVRITNIGTGPAREMRIDDIVSDACLSVEVSDSALGTFQVGESFVFDIAADVAIPAPQASFLVNMSWARLGDRVSCEFEFTVEAQREDVAWDQVELTEPYSLEAVTSGDELIGRKTELRQLHRLANLKAVGSGFIYGQKRVGKTSLANAVAESLESNCDANWIVISKGSGDYVGDDAISTLRSLGEVIVQSLKQRIPCLASVPDPDFSNGLAPLSSFVDEALSEGDRRLLFILDEFDELPLDLLRRTDLSTSLFQPLRQISNKPGCGFLLVGGEGMQQIINLQGDRLNKFRQVEVDYFTRSDNWSDFVELVRRPVQDWLTISDSALEELFTSSAGNPYFAKLLASQLFSDMVENRHSDASEVDMTTAIEKMLRSIGGNAFAHFWTDGLVEHWEDAEKTRMVRRSFLIAIGRALRKHNNVNSDIIWDEFKTAINLPIDLQSFRFTLHDFESRKVLIEDAHGTVTAKVPIFQSWLKEKGVGELLGDSRELQLLQSGLQDEENIRVKDDEILNVCNRLEHFRYRGRAIDPIMIRNWIHQFNGPADQRLMFRLLSGIQVYDENTVRAKMKEAFKIVTRNMHTLIEANARVRNDIFVSSLDDSAAKSGLTYCRMFASENAISSQLAQPLSILERRIGGLPNVQRLVLIDDFSGTGQTLLEGIKRELELLRFVNQQGIQILLLALVGFGEARSRIEEFLGQSNLDARVYFCDELGSEHKVFSEESAIFQDPDERNRARQIAEEKGLLLERKQPLGYGDTQASVVFYQSCPNNTLPIFWSRNHNWSPLFARM